jgi:hypothetical protein
VQQGNKFYLSGTSLYVFDIATKSLNKIADVSTNPFNRYYTASVTGTTVCLGQWSVYGDDSGKMSFDEMQKTLKEYPPSLTVDTMTKNVTQGTCSQPTPTPILQKEQNGMSIFKQLSLPSGYAIFAPK